MATPEAQDASKTGWRSTTFLRGRCASWL